MTNAGSESFDYGSFKMVYDSDPVIQALVKRFDQNGVELTTKKDSDVGQVDQEGGDAVEKMAKRATNKALA
jgi:hypothetical protein